MSIQSTNNNNLYEGLLEAVANSQGATRVEFEAAQKAANVFKEAALSILDQQNLRLEKQRASLAALRTQKAALMAAHKAKVAALIEQVAKETALLKEGETELMRVTQQKNVILADSKTIEGRIGALKMNNPFTDTQYLHSTGFMW